MKQNYWAYRILALGLAILMLCSSISFNLDVHLCQGEIKSSSLFGKAKNCYELTGNSSPKSCVRPSKKCSTQKGVHLQKRPCCESKTIHLTSQQQQFLPTIYSSVAPTFKFFVIAFASVFLVDVAVEYQSFALKEYCAPVFSQDIYVQIQSFLL